MYYSFGDASNGNQHLETSSEREWREAWVLQTLLLTMIFAAYSGDPEVFERGLALQSVLGNVFNPLLIPS